MQGFKCQVTGAVGNKKIAKAKPPVWCADDQSKCRTGAKQMIVFQREPHYMTDRSLEIDPLADRKQKLKAIMWSIPTSRPQLTMRSSASTPERRKIYSNSSELSHRSLKDTLHRLSADDSNGLLYEYQIWAILRQRTIKMALKTIYFDCNGMRRILTSISTIAYRISIAVTPGFDATCMIMHEQRSWFHCMTARIQVRLKS
jgi:hypothetical protein